MRSILLVLMFIFTICTSLIGGRRELVLKRATFDLNCNKSELKIVDLGDYAFGVTGCGRSVYRQHLLEYHFIS